MAISQGSYPRGEDYERGVLRNLLSELNLRGELFHADVLKPSDQFQLVQKQRANLMPTVVCNQEPLERQVREPFQGRRHIPVVAANKKTSHGQSIT